MLRSVIGGIPMCSQLNKADELQTDQSCTTGPTFHAHGQAPLRAQRISSTHKNQPCTPGVFWGQMLPHVGPTWAIHYCIRDHFDRMLGLSAGRADCLCSRQLSGGANSLIVMHVVSCRPASCHGRPERRPSTALQYELRHAGVRQGN